MLKQERHSFIIRQIDLHNKVSSSDLALQLDVSEDTVRRDLNELGNSGQIVKVHGGALSKSFHYPFNENNVYAIGAKRQIAVKAINLIKDGMVILTGGGTTMIEMARLVPKNIALTIFTVSPLVALQFADHPLINTILIGGHLSKDSQVCFGAPVNSYLAEVRFDICFLGTNCISINNGVTDSDPDIVYLKKSMIKASDKLIIMCISEKLNSSQRMRVCELHQVTGLITELDPADPSLVMYQREKIKLL
ncbi:DeoR/GlpR family DNA-binding transcription regulator [soil metagenome]|jgi:DeoR/GlpR family transcriptional regulator of sugar metabolism